MAKRKRFKRVSTLGPAKIVAYKIEYGVTRVDDAFSMKSHMCHNGQVDAKAEILLSGGRRVTMPLPAEFIKDALDKEFRLILEVKE
jgi:hypothetical protein